MLGLQGGLSNSLTVKVSVRATGRVSNNITLKVSVRVTERVSVWAAVPNRPFHFLKRLFLFKEGNQKGPPQSKQIILNSPAMLTTKLCCGEERRLLKDLWPPALFWL